MSCIPHKKVATCEAQSGIPQPAGLNIEQGQNCGRVIISRTLKRHSTTRLSKSQALLGKTSRAKARAALAEVPVQGGVHLQVVKFLLVDR